MSDVGAAGVALHCGAAAILVAGAATASRVVATSTLRPATPISPVKSPSTMARARSAVSARPGSFGSSVGSSRRRLEVALGGTVEVTPRGRDALVLALERSGISPVRDHVCLLTTTGSGCVSPCVQWALGRWRWTRTVERDTRAVVVIHEWGIPHPDLDVIARTCRERGWALIEDCAHALLTSLWSGAVGRAGNWAIYSLPKFTSLASGGLLCRPHRTPSTSVRRPRNFAAAGARAGSPSPSTQPPLSLLGRGDAARTSLLQRTMVESRGPRPAWEMLRCAQVEMADHTQESGRCGDDHVLRQTPESAVPASYDSTISELLDHVEDEAMVRRAAWARYEAVARDLGAFPALALPEAAVPWKLALRLRGVHRLVASLRTRGYDAEACAHVWAALLHCGTGVSPSAGEVRRLLESCSDPGAALPPIRVVERFIPA